MTGAVREAVTLAGRAERARVAHAFIDGVLGPGHPCWEVAALLVGEPFVNSQGPRLRLPSAERRCDWS
jgi:hypothetical protein